MREFLGIDKALQSIWGELLNKTSKLTEINQHIKRDTKKLEARRLEYWKTGKARDIVTKSGRSSNTSCKDLANHWKSPW